MSDYTDKSYKLYRLYSNILIVAGILAIASASYWLASAKIEHIYIDDLPQQQGVNPPTDPVVSEILRNKTAHLLYSNIFSLNSIVEREAIKKELTYIDKFYMRRDIITNTVVVKYTIKSFYGAFYDEAQQGGALIGDTGTLYPIYTLSRYEALKSSCFVINRANTHDTTELLAEVTKSNLPPGCTIYLDKNTFDIDYNNIHYRMGLYKNYQTKFDQMAKLAPYLAAKYIYTDIEYVNLVSAEFPAIKLISKPNLVQP